jgi:predicted ATP-grasp superfamily ATP-dependent carboligase
MCEFVTGGGMRGHALPASLAREGLLMRDALARDLCDLPGVEVTTTHDDRLAAPSGATSVAVGEDLSDPAATWALWARLAGEADAAWVVAPETDDLLGRLSALCRDAGALVIGPDAEAIRVASLKSETAARLEASGIRTPATWFAEEPPSAPHGPFVSKPDDGAGCGNTRFWRSSPKPGALPANHVVQPVVPGEHASLTVLRSGGTTTLLSANRQHVTVKDGVFAFSGLTVASLADPDGILAGTAESVSRALPGLDGIFGIDLVIAEDGPVVIEINPRLTTAYAGLREALGVNPAGLVRPFAEAGAPAPRLATKPVEIAT